ncbi:MAG: RND transporter [Bacteroidetes bacterium]|nr:MAG: RND transporter [Bacteroidota bacterium]
MTKKFLSIFFISLAGFVACKNQQKAKEEDAPPSEVKTPVTVTPVELANLEDSIELNATSTFLQSSYVKSNANGYVVQVNAKPGEFVKEGKTLFLVQTKESMVIGNAISSLDSSFKFSGVNVIKAQAHGYITQLNHEKGDYVQDGDQLAVISNMNSFAFLLNIPYELKQYALNQKSVKLTLPDGTRLQGTITSVMPIVDSLSQTVPVVIKVNSSELIPEDLIAKVLIIKNQRAGVQTLPKSAVLSDEAQTNFWVMKMIDSVTAVRTEIKKGLDINNRVEIISPRFTPQDRIVLTGNYGLSDTARVIVQN